MRDRLQTYLAGALPNKERLQVGELENLSVGWESDVYGFDLTQVLADGRKRDELVLRIYQGDGASAKSTLEFRAMQRLYDAGYPIPHVLMLEQEGSPFGKPFVIMERIDGEMLWPIWFRDTEERQRAYLTQFCRLLVDLHTLDWRPLVDKTDHHVGGDPYRFVDGFLASGRSFLAEFDGLGFLPLVAWLEARRDHVPCTRPAPIHWDFHPANILLREDGSAVVIDWTQFEVSDARFDLAWTMLLVGSQQDPQWRNRILQEYQRLSGAEVEEIEYFEVIACIKRLASIAITLAGNAEKLGMRADAEGKIRGNLGPVRQVYDQLLNLTGIEVPEVEAIFQ